MTTIGKLQRVPLRDVWSHEALDFTLWLEDNIDVVSESIGVELTNAEREQSAGAFSVDILAEDEEGNFVVIENQLGRSDHDHLGKLITYLTAFDAQIGVWIVAKPRPEHVQSITWLNESASASFYLLKIEAVRIGESLPAPLLTSIVAPSAETRAVGEQKQELAERKRLRHEFWSMLLESLGDRLPLFDSVGPRYSTWMGASAGTSGFTYRFRVRQHDAGVELKIDTGVAEENEALFDNLYANKSEIEDCFGAPLDWRRAEEHRSCRIVRDLDIGGYRDPNERWPDIQEAMIDAMIRFEQALQPHIVQLKSGEEEIYAANSR